MPAELAYSIMPPGRMTQKLAVSLRNTDNLYPLPVLTITYEYAPGKRTKLSEPVPIRREAELARIEEPPALDGRLTDDCWKTSPALRTFGSRSGDSCPTEPTSVWIARDDKMLYIAARCAESVVGPLKSDAANRDGKVHEDVHDDGLRRNRCRCTPSAGH